MSNNFFWRETKANFPQVSPFKDMWIYPTIYSPINTKWCVQQKCICADRWITLKQAGWQLILRCSMEILASLPTISPQYVQVDDSEPLGETQRLRQVSLATGSSSSHATAALSGKITCDPFCPVWGNLISVNNPLMSSLSLLMSRLGGISALLLAHI